MLKNLSYLCEVFRKDLHEIWGEIWQTSYDFKYINKLSIVQIKGWERLLKTDSDNMIRVMNDVKKEIVYRGKEQKVKP